MEKIDKSKIRYNSNVEAIDIEKKTVLINGEEYVFKKLINTMPLNNFVKLLSNKYASITDGVLSCNKVLVFNLGFDKPAVDTYTHWTYVPMKKVNFYRCGFYNNILGDDRLSMYIEIGYKENDSICIEEQLEQTIKNLRELGIITDHKLISYNSLVINPGYVHITDGSNRKVNELRKELSSKQVYTIGRYGKWTYCSIEDCMLDAIELARK